MIEPALQDELRRIASEPILVIACDFDGTLAAIAPTVSIAGLGRVADLAARLPQTGLRFWP